MYNAWLSRVAKGCNWYRGSQVLHFNQAKDLYALANGKAINEHELL